MSKEKKAATAVAEKPAVKEEKAAEPEKVYITSRQVADELGIKPTVLRRYLRTLPHFQDGGYTRYKWDPSDPKDAQFLKDVKASYEKYTRSAEEKKEARDKERAEQAAKKKAEKEAAGEAAPKKEKKSKKAPEPEPEEDEEDVFEGEDEEELD